MKSHLLAAVFALLVGGTVPAATHSLGTEWTYQNVLSSTVHGSDLRFVIASYQHDPSLRDSSMQDLLAETLFRGVNQLEYSQVDLVRMARTFRELDSPRYATFMGVIAANTEYLDSYGRHDRENRHEVHKIATRFAEKHAGTRAAQYVPGSIDFHAMRTRFAATAPTRTPTSAQGRKLLTIPIGPKGATFDDVLAIQGMPQRVHIGAMAPDRRHYIVNGARVLYTHFTSFRRPDRMHFDYRGLGRVTFFFEGEAGWRAGRVTADPILVERAFPIAPEDDMALRMQELLYGGYASARQAIEARQLVSFTPEVKDTIAELLARNYANQKVEFIDDTFWVMSRFLVRSDQGRYGPMIKEIAARSADKRIKKLSEMIDPAAVDAASAYVPGTVRLEEKRLAYPPFYPESTFIGPVGGEDDVQDETPDQTAE
jgi:hypothetical protein